MRVYVVDDDQAVLETLARAIDRFGHQTFTFGNAQKFLDAVPMLDLGCVFLDYCMPDIDGLAVQQRLAEMNCLHPVVLLTGIGEVPEAVAAMRAGAIDFLRKPIRHAALSEALTRVENRLAQLDRFAALSSLTDREREVLIALADGKPTKIVAHDIGISTRTVEAHRSAVLHKLGVLNMTAAVLMAQQAGLLAA